MRVATLRPTVLAAWAALMLAGCGQQGGTAHERVGGPPAIGLAQGGAAPLAAAPASQRGQVFLVAGTTEDDGDADGYTMLSHFRNPDGVAGDAAGNIYVADTGNHTIRRISPDGLVITVAGKAGAAGSSDGRGSAARFNGPAGLRIDDAGNLYVADVNNHTIRRVAPDGVVSTVAGKAGEYGTADGVRGVARLAQPQRLAIGPGGVLYVASVRDGVIRKVMPDGAISTVVTDAPRVHSRADSEPGLLQFGEISGIAADRDGNVYVADARDNTVRKIAPNGHVSHVAGQPRASAYDYEQQTKVDGAGAQAQFNRLGDLVANRDGSLAVLSDFRVRRISAAGAVTTAAQFNSWAYDNLASALGVDRNGDVLIARQRLQAYHQHSNGWSAIFRVAAGAVLAPVAPKPLAAPAAWQDGNLILGSYPGTLAEFQSVAIGPGGMPAVADDSLRLLSMDQLGRFAERKLHSDGKDGNQQPRLWRMTFDSAGNLYAADLFRIHKISPQGEVSTWAEFPNTGGEITGIAVTAAGAVYATGNGVVYRMLSAGQVEVYAGAAGDNRHADGNRLQARFTAASGLSADANGNLYVGDGYTVRKISPDGMVTTLAGRPGVAGTDDGAASSATFTSAWALAADPRGNVYVAQSAEDYLVRRIGTDGVVTTVAGTRGAEGITLDSLGPMRGIAAAPNGDIYLISGKALLRLEMPRP